MPRQHFLHLFVLIAVERALPVAGRRNPLRRAEQKRGSSEPLFFPYSVRSSI